MYLEALISVLSLNLTVPHFLAGHNGTINITVGGSWNPNIYIDFGDLENVTVDPSNFVYRRGDSSGRELPTWDIAISHRYSNPGSYVVLVNASSAISHSVRSAVALVSEPITGVELTLMTEPLVALFDEVVVRATVLTGTDLKFEWDFGDSTEGEYTNVSSDGKSSVAHHSYAIPDTYTVSVSVSTGNHPEFITAFLNTSIRAVEPMEQLHLRPSSGRYAAPLIRKGLKGDGGPGIMYTTKVILFEAKLYRGSDVEFIFDFGDGQKELVPLELNVWSVPLGIAKHSYTSEGAFSVSVTATNPLGSIMQNLEQPFYVQFPPEELTLDKLYYIIPKGDILRIEASVIKGTNVSYHWFLGGNELINVKASKVDIPFPSSGTYLIRVNASNKVTDLSYDAIRPSATAKVYVQEPLQEIELCVLSLERSQVCTGKEVSMPLEDEIEFVAKVIPKDEKALRFIWQTGTKELRKTNIPTLQHRYSNPGWYVINATAQNHISSISSNSIRLHLVRKISNLTGIRYEEPALVNHPISFHALYWFGTNLTFEWNFGDESALIQTEARSVQHTYTKIGEYLVTVFIWNKFSSAHVTTNIFLLNHPCQKPKISFLDQSRNRVVTVLEDILLEADITTSCPEHPVPFFAWTLSYSSGEILYGIPLDRMKERQLVLTKGALLPGLYTVALKVQMNETIVYATATTNLTIEIPVPHIFMEGGFFRSVGLNDLVSVAVKVAEDFHSNENLSFHWSCSPLSMMYIPCFKNDPPAAFSNSSWSNFTFSVTSLNSQLLAIVLNVTVIGKKQALSSQVLEITGSSQSLMLSVKCYGCHNNHANQEQWLKFSASCANCLSSDVKYLWKIWLVQDGNHYLYHEHHKCVQADGSTLFIVASNETTHELNTTAVNGSHHGYDTVHLGQNAVNRNFHNDDFPPFPSLPGFPDEQDSIIQEGAKKSRLQRDSEVIMDMDEIAHRSFISSLFPIEGEVSYEDNSSIPEAFQEYFHGHDDLLTEEGHPGEVGSAAARDQSGLQHFGILPTSVNQDNRILEGTGNGRGVAGNGLPDLYPARANDPYHNHLGDPVRHSVSSHETGMPHLVTLPRLLLTLSPSDTASGFYSQSLVLKPGALQIGRTYLIEVHALQSGHHAMEGSATELIRIRTGPLNGRCTLMPTQGHSIDFMFRLHCFEWQNENSPLYYELSYSLYPEGDSHLVYFGFNKNVKFVLPSGLVDSYFNVYLNVVVRDSQGAGTKVCSLVREVKPLNVSMEEKIYNQTFDPKSALNKLVGEKHNQAVLQRIHVLAVSLNQATHSDSYSTSSHNIKNLHMRKAIRQQLLKLIDMLVFFSKAEAVQAISALVVVVFAPEEVGPTELKYGWDLFLKIHNMKSTLCGSYPLELLIKKFLSFIDKFIFFTSASVSDSSYKLTEALHTAKRILRSEIKDVLRNSLVNEEDCIFELPHRTISANYLTSMKLRSGQYTITVKNSVLFLSDVNLLTVQAFPGQSVQMQSNLEEDLASSDICVIIAEEEYHPSFLQTHPHLSPSYSSSVEYSPLVSLSFSSCNDSIEGLHGANHPANFSITAHFQREEPSMDLNHTFSLWKKNMNVHVINLTHDDINHSLSFIIEVMPVTDGKREFALEVMFSYKNMPTLKTNLKTKRFEAGSKALQIFIPETMVKGAGLYYLAIMDADYNVGYPYKDVTDGRKYRLFGWLQQCVQKTKDIWSPFGCTVLDTSMPQSVHCKCSSVFGITSYSKPVTTELLLFPVDNLMEGHWNVLPSVFWTLLMVVYLCLCIVTYYDDIKKPVKMAPVSLKDNTLDDRYEYLITIRTGSFRGAGTSSSVYMVLHGQKGMTETRQLVGHAVHTNFQRGSVDHFILSTSRYLGPLIKLEVWHNNYGPSPSWYLRDVEVKDFQNGSVYYFQCHRWFSVENEDGKIEREISVADHRPKFQKVLHDHLITSLNDINIWNSVICSSPVSPCSGVQRLTCCLSFILNSAAVMLWFHGYLFFEYKENYIIPHISLDTLCECVITTILMSVPQLLSVLLFRFSSVPQTKLTSKFWNLFTTWTWDSLYCWLQQKHSSHRTSSSESSSSIVDSSGSSYINFSHSSLHHSELSLGFSSDEKEVISDSMPSSLNLDVPVSPLEKTLSTWQAFENWARRKRETSFISDFLSNERHSFLENLSSQRNADVSENFLLCRIENDINAKENSNKISNFLLDCGTPSPIHGDEIENTNDVHGVQENVYDVICNVPNEKLNKFHKEDSHEYQTLLSSSCYFLCWILLLSQCAFSSYVINCYGIRFGVWKSVQWLQNIVVTILCSCFLFYPLLACIVAIVLSLTFLRRQRQFKEYCCAVDDKSTDVEGSYKTDEYKRRAYFMNYLRPPAESLLNESRKIALRYHFILSFFRNISFSLVVLAILSVMAFFNVNYNYFLQKKSIENAFERSEKHAFIKTEDLWSWMKTDFLSAFYGDYSCLDDPYSFKECGILISCGSYSVGSPVIKKFSKLPSACSTSAKYDSFNICNSEEKEVAKSSKHLHFKRSSQLQYQVMLWGFHGFYSDHEDAVSLNNSRHDAYIYLDILESEMWIDKRTEAVSLEFLLFNPAFSNFISVVFLIEFNHIGEMSFFAIIKPFHLYWYSNLSDYIRLFCELSFLVLFLVNLKKEIWRMLKLKKSYWSCPWNCLQAVLLLVSICYTTSYVLYVIAINEALQVLKDTHMEVYVNLLHVPYMAMAVQYQIGLLIFLHLISCLKYLQIKSSFSFLNTYGNCWKQLMVCGAVGIFVALNCGFLENTVIGHKNKKTPAFPLVQCLQAISLFMANYKKPEISSHASLLVTVISFIFIFFVFWASLCTLAMVRVILINGRKCRAKNAPEKFCLKEAAKLIKMKLSNHFKSSPHRIILKENKTLPMEFLLLELETLTDRLVSKADSLFTGSTDVGNMSDVGSYSRISNPCGEENLCENICTEASEGNEVLDFQLEMFDSEYPVSSCESSCEYSSSLSSVNSSQHSYQEVSNNEESKPNIVKVGIPLTLPRSSSRTRANNCSKVSFFTSSLTSQRGHSRKTAKSPESPQQSRIRKTYPLRKTGSTSSSDHTDFPQEQTGYSPVVPSVRKTKSRGKGKNKDLNLDQLHLDDSSL